MKNMATSVVKFCSLCDPSPIKAVEWCSECDDFLCSDCTKHHKASKASKQHSTISIKDYEELPDFVRELSYICDDHDERIDTFCPVHNCACCIRCAWMTHKSCDGVAPLKDFIQDVKNSSTIRDMEQTLSDIHSFIAKLSKDKESNKHEMHLQENRIHEEIRQIRISLNDHLDRLEQTFINSLKGVVAETVTHIDNLIQKLIESKDRIDKISNDLEIIQNKATNLQAFLSMSKISCKVVEEEKYIQQLQDSGKLKRKAVAFRKKIEDFINTKSLGDVVVDEVEGSIDYVKKKDKQAQIIGASLSPQCSNICLKQIARLQIDVAKDSYSRTCNQISGCNVLRNGNFLFAEHNSLYMTDRLTLCDKNGHLIRQFSYHNQKSVYDVTRIDQNTCALSTNHTRLVVDIIDITSGTTLSNIDTTGRCYGLSCTDDLLIFCCVGQGIRTYNTNNKENRLLVKERNLREFSYVCTNGNRIIYTCGAEAVVCCGMDGKVMWKFKDTSVLRSPRGVAVDKNGFCFVSGEDSGNIVVISPDGKNSKEVCKVLHPRAICYDETKHQIIACNRSEAILFQISENV